MIPSKQLLSEVLGVEVDRVKGIEHNTLIYGVPTDGWYKEINIHELTHKMKSCIPEEVILILWKNKFGWGVRMDTPENETFYQDGIFKTEFEAVTKAYKWIMEQTKCGS